MKDEAAEKFRTVREAYEVLSNGPSKLRYDTELGVKKTKKKKHKKPEQQQQPPGQTPGQSQGSDRAKTPRREKGPSSNNHSVAEEGGNCFNQNTVGVDAESPGSNNRRKWLANSVKIGIIVIVNLSFTCVLLFN